MKRKAKFRVGEVVNLPVKIVRVDRRYRPPFYTISGAVVGWVMNDEVREFELTREHGERSGHHAVQRSDPA